MRVRIIRLIYVTALLVFTASCSVKENTGTIAPLAFPVTNSAGEPYLFSDANEKVFLTWVEDYDTVSVMKMAHLMDTTWSDPVILATGTDWFVNWADYPMAVSGANEKFMAHYLDRSGPGKFSYDVKLTTSQDGITWNTPFILHDDAKEAEHGFVSLVPYGEHVFVSWLDGRNTVGDAPDEHVGHDHHGEMSLRAAVVTFDGDKVNEWELDNRTCDCCQTTSAITKNGPVVIYRDRSETEVRDISIVRFVNNQWTQPISIFKDNWEINGCPVNGPRCEAISNTLAIAWFTMANNTPAVKVIFSTDGGETFGKPIHIPSEEAIGRVDLVLIDESTALISWMEGSSIMVTKVQFNGTVDTPLKVSETTTSRSSGFPQMTRFGNSVVFAWTDNETRTIKTAKLVL